jgi:HK97 family phage portal protein
MSLLTRILVKGNAGVSNPTNLTLPELMTELGQSSISASGENVSSETSKRIATAYRCGNIISDDIAKMPFQQFQKTGQSGNQRIIRVQPDPVSRNMAWRIEVQPNYLMTPFIFKKTLMQWVLFWGAGYVWSPPNFRELIILPTDRTYPEFLRKDGSLWYSTVFPNGKQEDLPAAEVMAIIINSIDGVTGRSVISYAKDTIGKQLAAHKTQSKLYLQGLMPAGIAWTAGELGPEGRTKVRKAYEEAMAGADNAYRLAVFDNRITKFDPITMKMTDAQFIESVQATDVDIANFFGLPLYKLNAGKQSYQSNAQQDLDYLKTTIDPYLVQWEQSANIRWVPAREQGITYHKFNRDSILQSDATARAAVVEKRIFSGVLTPNEGRELEEQSAYAGGEQHYIPGNMVSIEKGPVSAAPATTPQEGRR